MASALSAPRSSASLRTGHYRARNVVRAEVWKVLTLRSSAVTIALTVAAGLLVTYLSTNHALHQPAPFYVGFDPTSQALGGMIVAALTGGVFGALLITGEYSSGTIRTTLSATPRRPVVLAAKLCVTAAVMAVVAEVLSFATFLLGQAVLAGGGAPHAGVSSPGALRAIVFTGLFIALLALMSFGFGLMVRSTAGAIAAFVGVVFVLPLVMRAISESALRYVPTTMLTNSVMSTTSQFGGNYTPLSATAALVLMAVYAALALAVGGVLFLRRDA